MRIAVWLGVALAATPLESLVAGWRSAGGEAPDAARGAALWTRQAPAPDGSTRSCTTCHGARPDAPGRHATTGEPIPPMTSPGRFEDPAEVEKWFGRNCRWTLGRECTPTEKADVATWIAGFGRTP